MAYNADSEYRVDRIKLEADLRDAYVELLSAQFAVDRLKLRYPSEMLALNGGSFLVHRSFTAARSIWEYFLGMQQLIGPNPLDNPDKATVRD